MTEGENQKNWSKRGNFAKCREPYKTEFDTLASQWIEGAMSDQELALELWQMRDTLQFCEGQSKPIERRNPHPDVQQELEILVQAMLSVAFYDGRSTVDDRRVLYEQARAGAGEDRSSTR